MTEEIIEFGYVGLILLTCAATVIAFLGGDPNVVTPVIGTFIIGILLAAGAVTVYKTVLSV
jgi:hypothetical protein